MCLDSAAAAYTLQPATLCNMESQPTLTERHWSTKAHRYFIERMHFVSLSYLCRHPHEILHISWFNVFELCRSTSPASLPLQLLRWLFEVTSSVTVPSCVEFCVSSSVDMLTNTVGFCVCILFFQVFVSPARWKRLPACLPVLWACVCLCAQGCVQVVGWICLCECLCMRVHPGRRVCVPWDARWRCRELDPLRCGSCCWAAVCVRQPATRSERPWTWMLLHASQCWAAVSVDTSARRVLFLNQYVFEPFLVHHPPVKWSKM